MGRFTITVLNPWYHPKSILNPFSPPIFFSFSPDPLWKILLFLFCCRNHAFLRRPNFSARPSMVFWRCPPKKWILSNLYGGWVIFYARRTFGLWYFFKFKASRKLSISAHFRLKQLWWQIFLVNSKNLVLACSERTIEYRGQTINMQPVARTQAS